MIKRIIHILFAPIGGALGYWIWLLLESVFYICKIELWGWVQIFLEIALISAMAVVGYFVGKIWTWPGKYDEISVYFQEINGRK